MKKHTMSFVAGLLTGEAPAQGNASVRVGSSKGSTLKEGVTSTLIIAPSRSDYTVTSSNPAVAH